MDAQSAANTYLQDAVENAPPVKVVHMLYQGALRFIDRALDCEADDPAFGQWLSRADSIVCELRLALDDDAAPELSDPLKQLYLFVEGELRSAQNEGQRTPAENAREVHFLRGDQVFRAGSAPCCGWRPPRSRRRPGWIARGCSLPKAKGSRASRS